MLGVQDIKVTNIKQFTTVKYRFVPVPVHLTFWFALFWNWPRESNGIASGSTANPSCVSPGGTRFQGDSGFIGLRSSDGFGLKGKTEPAEGSILPVNFSSALCSF